MSDFRKFLIEYVEREAQPREKFSHQPRLYALAQQIGAGYSYDDDVVFAAVWLHDLGVFYGHRPQDVAELEKWDNTAYAVRQAPAILAEAGFPPEKIPAVQEAIRTHQPAQRPASIEAEIIRDADILEQLGAIGILRTVCKVGRDTRFHDFASAINALQRAVDTLPAQVRLSTTRQLLPDRVRAMEKFLKHAREEAGEWL